jgi:cytochrome c oxidase subunit IV
MEAKLPVQASAAAEVGSHEHFSEHVRRYLFVFYALIFGTLATVGVCKASLVASYFMHLISEKKLIYGIMIFTAFFFLGLMFLTLAAYSDFPMHTIAPYTH